MKKILAFLSFVLLLFTNLSLEGQVCTLSGTYNNQSEFQTAINNAAPSCSVITLTGDAAYSGNITIPSNTRLVIAGTGSITINGNSSFTSVNFVRIEAMGVFDPSSNTTVNIEGVNITVNQNGVTGPGSLNASGFLPVQLSSFDGILHQKLVKLTWQTSTELNNAKFIIETSHQGETFQRIGEVAGAGTTTEPQNYSFTHHTPSAGINYYRLKQVDFDGTFEYSKVIAIDAPGSHDVFAFPNPAREKISVQYDQSKGAGNIQLLDALGRRIQANIAGYAGNYEVTLPESLARGTYWLKVERNGKVQTLPVVKE